LADKTIAATPSEERAELERRVEHKDREIDESVYALHALTDAERRLVEEGTPSP
jgi:hypothetical protein